MTNNFKDDSPDTIGPETTPKMSFSEKGRRTIKAFTTKEGLVGDYDYAFLFKPQLPFMKRARRAGPFFGLNDKMPVFLALLLGFQHALAMLAGIITPPIILSSSANLIQADQQYLVSACLIMSGAFSQMYATGFCPSDADGNHLPCPDGYGALIATSCVCALLEILMSFTPPKILKKIFPPIVTGPTVMLIGVSLISSGFENWAGGSGNCQSRPESGLFSLCPNINAPHALPWGSAEFIGLGFLVFVSIILTERFGSPIMKSCAVVIGLLVGCIVAAACGYFDRSGIDAAPVANFIWVRTFKLQVYGPLVLPLLTVYIVLAMEAIGDITASCDVSRLQVDGATFNSRIQGGVLADGLNGLIAGLCTLT
ncbi:purine permease [Aureobasidium sp. EXF-12298]|nr:purine permease [Aureobasidium sp. EXF-12298]KAI4763517.1 purine permease [Aureobasidium sp. EXF-12344]KAI4780619.1 purine permease [Aureobasidium sp. EXF-3400]